MITLFESFNDINIKPFIINDDGVFKIPSFNFKYFGEWFVKNQKIEYYKPIKYNTLMRFYVYLTLLRYKGNNPTILKYIQGIKNKDPEKIEIIDKIPNNLIVMKTINSKYNLGFPINNNFDDLKELKKLILLSSEIFSDENLVEFIRIVSNVSKTSKKSEKVIKGVVNMLFGKFYQITTPTEYEDKMGVDLWMINKETGERKGVQVKDIPDSASFNIIDDTTILINNTSLDLKPYRKKKNPELKYDYLVFFIESEKKACFIKSTAIFMISKYDKNIRIKLEDWSKDPKFHNHVFKMIDIPEKFLPKDVSKIFYDPQKKLFD